MRRIIFISMTALFAAVAYAQQPMNIESVGTATQVVNNKDTLLIFKDEIHLKSKIGEVNWYSTKTNEVVYTNTDEIYPDDGGFYIKKDDEQYAPVYAFLYSEPVINTITLTAECEATTLTLPEETNDAKPLSYTRPDGSTGIYKRACTISYNALTWNGEMWADSAAQMNDEKLQIGNYYMPALYGATPVSLCYDSVIRYELGLEPACIETELPADQVIAINLQLTHIASTSRGTKEENEPKRPTSETLVETNQYSAPLDVAFYSNPTPATEFYQWTIVGPSNTVTRHDQDIRHIFSEPGKYTVICKVRNALCEADSMTMTVAITESFIDVPNVFTPNGDGQNDEFRVAYKSIAEFHCWVYNRWGKLVYDWTDPAKGWDGTINGRPAAEGAYFYVIRAKGTDAAKGQGYISKPAYNRAKKNSDTKILGIYQLSGDINLLRGKSK